VIGSIGAICGRAAVGPAGPAALSRRARSARHRRSMVPGSARPTEGLHFPRLSGSFLAIFEEILEQAPRISRRSGPCLAGLRWRDFSRSASALRVFESPSSAEPLSRNRIANSWVLRRLKNPKRVRFVCPFRWGIFRSMPIDR